MTEKERLRELPAVHEVAERILGMVTGVPRAAVVAEVRRAVGQARSEILAGNAETEPVEARIVEALTALKRPSLRRLINATGVVLHTNLGRAPLASVPAVAGYSNLEYDVETGRRGKRDNHIAPLIERLLGAPGIAVNNNAAAIFLALNEIALNAEVIVSRGELIEIGDGFRIPDIMARSGATLREVGTTNRTTIADYHAAITERTRMLLRVHPSNFCITGFTARPELAELVSLGRERNLPVYEDLGSGCIVDLSAFGIDEPPVASSLAAGVSLVSFSGDKLMGGPQAGILAGEPELLARLRRNPLFRAFRLDKLATAALESTLRNLLLENWEAIPAIAMIRQSAEEIRARAAALCARVSGVRIEIVPGASVIGGGATPEKSLPTWLMSLDCRKPAECERRLRAGTPPVVARIENDRILIDLRTVLPEEEGDLAAALTSLAD